MRGVEMGRRHIDGEIQSLVINGVDVAPLVEAELDRRYPDLLVVLNEEWWHRMYAERDLAFLEKRD